MDINPRLPRWTNVITKVLEAGGRKMNMKRRRWDDGSRGQRKERLGDSMLLALNTEKGAVAKEVR